MSSLHKLQLPDHDDLSKYKDKLETLNMQLAWVGQGMPESYLIHLAQTQLKTSRYAKDIDALQISNTASGTSFHSLHDFFTGLECLDRLRGLPYGGAAITKPTQKPYKKPSTTIGMVASVQESSVTSETSLVLHSDPWIGAINLDETHVKILRSMFKCPQCRTNNHTFPSCPLLKNWVIKRKVRTDLPPESQPSEAARSAAINNTESMLEGNASSSSHLETIQEMVPEDDFDSQVEFDLLQDDDDNQDNQDSDDVYPYSDFKVPLGSVKSVVSSTLDLPPLTSNHSEFNVIIDSGCTRHMFHDRTTFPTYKQCSHSFVILADKSKTACLGIGTITIILGGKEIVLHDVLHVPNLRSPLLSVRCFRRLKGCSFISDNSGCFLTFPTFFLPVDDSSDCIIKRNLVKTPSSPSFDSRLVGTVSAVSDNTRHRSLRRPAITSRKTETTSLDSSNNNNTLTHSTSSQPTNNIPSSLPTILETTDSQHLPEVNECNLPNISSPSTSPLSSKQIQDILQNVTKHLETHGRITPELLHLLGQDKTRPNVSTSTTPSDHPTLLSSDKMSNTVSTNKRFTIQQLSRYFGFRSFKNWDILYDVCQPNFSLLKTSEKLLELGQVANMKKARSNKIPVERPVNYLEVVHCDIGFGDCKSVGNGALYCITLVDRATRYSWIYPLKYLHHDSLKSTFQQWMIDCGGCPSRLYSDFDPKILDGPTANFLRDKNIILRGAPTGRQNQNGLVERAWETATNMARSFITDMQMPKNFWYWALRHSIQVMNYIPCTVSGISTTPHELVYGIKPDLRILLRLFSTGYFHKLRDNSVHRSGIGTSTSMQGIALGWCRKTDGMIFYSPHSKELYMSSDYKIDEGRHTLTAFNLHYDGGIFVGQYSHNTPVSFEPYPEGTTVSYPTRINPSSNTTTVMRGIVISVPISSLQHGLPPSDKDVSPYIIKLVDGSIH